MSHFHIQWNGKDLDWEAHKTRAAAEESARELGRSGETYAIMEVRDQDCETCRAIAVNSSRTEK